MNPQEQPDNKPTTDNGFNPAPASDSSAPNPAANSGQSNPEADSAALQAIEALESEELGATNAPETPPAPSAPAAGAALTQPPATPESLASPVDSSQATTVNPSPAETAAFNTAPVIGSQTLSSSQTPVSTPVTSSEVKKKTSPLVILLLVVVLIAIIGVSIYFVTQSM